MILHPASYRSLSDDMELTRSGRDRLVGHICVVLKKLFEARLLDPVDIRGRAKHLYGVYTKMKRKSFKARHAKNIAKGVLSAAYWANKVKW